MKSFLYPIFYQPLFNLLALLSLFFSSNLGLAIFVLAIGIRILMWPWYGKITISQKKLTRIQPQIQEIQKKYKADPRQANQLVFQLFKDEKVNPLATFGFVILQFFLFIGIWVLLTELIKNGWGSHLYHFLPQVPLNFMFLSFDLAKPNLFLTIIYVVLGFISGLLQKETSQNKMLLFFPFIFLLIYKSFPSALMVFWIGLSLVDLIQRFQLRNIS